MAFSPACVRSKGGVSTDFALLGLLVVAGAAGMMTGSPELTFAVFLGGLAVYLILTLPAYIREQVAAVSHDSAWVRTSKAYLHAHMGVHVFQPRIPGRSKAACMWHLHRAKHGSMHACMHAACSSPGVCVCQASCVDG